MRAGVLILAAAAMMAAGCSSRKKPAKAAARPVGWHETGIASWYGNPYHGRRAANGEIFDMEKLTAAHRTLAFNTWLRVHNLDNGKSVVVRITDRGPFVGGRIIDLSRAAAREIDMIGPGLAKVRIEVIRAPEHRDAPAPWPVAAGRAPRAGPPGVPAGDSRVSERGMPSDPGDAAAAVPDAGRAGLPAPGREPASARVASPAVPPGGAADVSGAAPAVDLYAVQAGLFSERANAERLRGQLERKYGAARLVAREGQRMQWRVLAGREETEEGAAALAERIRADFNLKDAFVVRLDPESAGQPAQDPLPLRPQLEQKPL